jgi:hypothetical protein
MAWMSGLGRFRPFGIWKPRTPLGQRREDATTTAAAGQSDDRSPVYPRLSVEGGAFVG